MIECSMASREDITGPQTYVETEIFFSRVFHAIRVSSNVTWPFIHHIRRLIFNNNIIFIIMYTYV